MARTGWIRFSPPMNGGLFVVGTWLAAPVIKLMVCRIEKGAPCGVKAASAVSLPGAMSKPALLPVLNPSAPMVSSCPELGDVGVPPGEPTRTRVSRFESIPYRVVDDAPAVLLV